MGLHKNIPAVDNHVVQSLTYATSVERLAATGFTANDVGRIAFQTDIAGFYALTNHSPITWTVLAAAGGADADFEVIYFGVMSQSGVVTTGGKGFKAGSYSGTIISWRLLADVASTITVDIWKTSGSIPTNANSITASAKPTLVNGVTSNGNTLTGWTTSLAADDILKLEVESNDNAHYIFVELTIQKS
jgi:hypothetical protein